MLMPIPLKNDVTVIFFPDAPDGEVVKRLKYEYTICRLPNGDAAIKRMTYFAGVNNVESVTRAIHALSDPNNPCNHRIREYLDVSVK